VRTKGDHVKLVLSKKTTILGQPITIKAVASDNQTVKILHNSRVVTNIKSGSSGEIDSRLLGQGHSKLYGVIQVNGKAIASVPMSIHVLPHSDE
jgi:hypothetical protein